MLSKSIKVIISHFINNVRTLSQNTDNLNSQVVLLNYQSLSISSESSDAFTGVGSINSWGILRFMKLITGEVSCLKALCVVSKKF